MYDTQGDITRVVKYLSQKPAVNTVRQSLLLSSSYKTDLLMQQIWRGYYVAQESHS